MGELQQPRNKIDPLFRQAMINSSNSFANRSKTIIRNNLGLFKCSEIYLTQNFQKHCHGSNGIKINIWQGKICQIN